MKKILPESSFEITQCRTCDGLNLVRVIDLGDQTIANNFTKWENFHSPKYPLFCVLCKDCGTFQLGYTVDKKALFQHYLYSSSVSPVFIKHMEELAKVVKGYNPELVVEIGSNDGVLLQPLQDYGIKAIGIEPAENMVVECRRKGFNVTRSWMESPHFGRDFSNKNGKADVVVACNVFAHIHNLKTVIRNAKNLMKEDGVMIVEVQHLLAMIQNNYFDMIYHEHFFNWSLYAFINMLDEVGMYVENVEEIPTHGGSLRIFARKGKGESSQNVKDIVVKEVEAGLINNEIYLHLQTKINDARDSLRKILLDIRLDGKKIIGYGAPAKANTLMTYFDIGKDEIEYIIDDAQSKQGLYTPCNHILIKAMPEKIEADYILILAWNFAESIMEKVRTTGYTGSFIIPFPESKIV